MITKEFLLGLGFKADPSHPKRFWKGDLMGVLSKLSFEMGAYVFTTPYDLYKTYFNSTEGTYLFFDTETNGFKGKYKNRIMSLGWGIYTKEGVEIFSANDFIKSDHWVECEAGAFKIHGITKEKCDQSGVSIFQALSHFNVALNSCKYLLAHNMNFDERIVKGEMESADFDPATFTGLAKHCTMKTTTDFCKIPSPKRSGYKWPSLQELHTVLFGVGFEDAHDSGVDVRVTAKCFFKMQQMFK